MQKDILNDIKKFYSEETVSTFHSKFISAGFSRFIELPSLKTVTSNNSPKVSTLNTIEWERLSSLKIENTSSNIIDLEFFAKFKEPYSVESLFDDFIKISHHYPRLHHFRDFPEYYASVLAGQRYFLFHGDGFCCQLAVLFQGLCQSLIGKRIKAMYCRNEDFTFSHGYCLDEDHYLDPDLKARFLYSEFSNFEPATWFVNLIENISIRSFENISSDDKKRLFLDRTVRYYEWLLTNCWRELSQPNSNWSVTHKLLHDVLPNNSEEYDVRADDYEWKAPYRRYASKVKEAKDHFFMHTVNEPIRIELPPNASLEINPKIDVEQKDLKILKNIFFGRTILKISYHLKANELQDIKFYDIPWLIKKNSHLTFVIDNKEFKFFENTPLLGMGDLNSLIENWLIKPNIKLKSDVDSSVSIYYPLNASLINSDLIVLNAATDNGLKTECYYE